MNVLKAENQMETSSEESLLVDNLNRTLDKYQDIPEDDAKAKVRNTVAEHLSELKDQPEAKAKAKALAEA